MTNSVISATDSSAGGTILSFPLRANEGAWDKLFALGARLAQQGEDGARLDSAGDIDFARSAFRFARCAVPAGWEIRDSDVSPWQKRLFDGSGKMIAKIFYKPAGGCGSIEVFLCDDVEGLAC